MNRLKRLSAILLLTCLSWRAQSADVQWTFANATNNPSASRVVFLTPLYTYSINGTNFIVGDRQQYTLDSSGNVIVSNLIAGSYRMEHVGPMRTTAITNTIPDTNGLIYATDYSSVAAASFAIAYSQGVSDSRFIRTNTIKNYVLKGDNMTFVTNANGSLTISSTGGGTSGALTNNDTRNVSLLGETITIGGGVDASVYVDGTSTEVQVTGDIRGSGLYITNIPGSGIQSSTITSNKLDGTAYVAFKNDVTAAGLAAGSYDVAGARSAGTVTNGNSITNISAWISSTYIEPEWTASSFGDGYHYYLTLPGVGDVVRIRSNSPPNRALYLGAINGSGGTQIDAVSIQARGNQYGNTDSRITFVHNGSHTNSSGVEIAVDPSWETHQTTFGANYIDPDSFDHVALTFLQHDFTNSAFLGVTNFNTKVIGTNITLATNSTIIGTLNPSGGIVGNRTISSFSMSHSTLYTNGNFRATFYATIALDPSGGDAASKIVTFHQSNSSTNFWADISVDDPAGEFLVPRYAVSCPLNPAEVFYILPSGTGGAPTITNAKVVSE